MIAESILPELDHEAATTRKLLERVPEADAQWKPHPKSYSLGDLAMHVANIPAWMAVTLQGTEFDVSPPGAEGGYKSPKFESKARLLEVFDENLKSARATLAATSDADMMIHWSLKNGGKTMFSMPRAAVVRSFVMNHLIHHRGQLSVYLRLRDIPLPPMYGPTADEAM